MLSSILAVCAGACAGALLRWAANLFLNQLCEALPLGTLAVNLAGGLIMGVAMSCFALFPSAAPQWKLLIVTGFLGSLTTFSAFSGEMARLLIENRLALSAMGIFLHVGGAILMVFAGIGLVNLARKIF